jgi:prepilin-type N-terminal cleavage/methylation domain-containing protein
MDSPVGDLLTSSGAPEPATPRRSRAYTLIEVLIAMVILVALYPALSTLVTGSRKAQVSGYRMEQASAFGRIVIDSLTIIPRNAWTTGSSVQTIAGVSYTASWTKPPGDPPWLFPVSVTWVQGAKVHQIQLQAVLQ